jgi:hypothetical protein
MAVLQLRLDFYLLCKEKRHSLGDDGEMTKKKVVFTLGVCESGTLGNLRNLFA